MSDSRALRNSIAVELGSSEEILADFGATDQLMTIALNPDIDRNGVYDADDGGRCLIVVF